MLRDAEVAQDLRADAVVAPVVLEAELEVGLDRVAPLILQRVGAHLVRQADAASLLVQVDEHAALARRRSSAGRARADRRSRSARSRTRRRSGTASACAPARRRGRRRCPSPARCARGRRRRCGRRRRGSGRRSAMVIGALGDAMRRAIRCAGDRRPDRGCARCVSSNSSASASRSARRPPGCRRRSRMAHTAAAGSQAGEARQIDRRLGQPGAHQHAAGAADDREDVPGHDDVVGAGVRAPSRRGSSWRGRCAEMPVVTPRRASIEAPNERRSTDGASGTMSGMPSWRMRSSVSAQADEAAAVRGHEVDRLRRHQLGGHAELRLARLAFGEDHEAAGAEVGQRGVDRRQRASSGPPARRAAAKSSPTRSMPQQAQPRRVGAGGARRARPSIGRPSPPISFGATKSSQAIDDAARAAPPRRASRRLRCSTDVTPRCAERARAGGAARRGRRGPAGDSTVAPRARSAASFRPLRHHAWRRA